MDNKGLISIYEIYAASALISLCKEFEWKSLFQSYLVDGMFKIIPDVPVVKMKDFCFKYCKGAIERVARTEFGR